MWFFATPTLMDLPYEIRRKTSVVDFPEPWFTVFYLSVFSIASVAILIAAWLVSAAIPSVASSLGYRKEQDYQVDIVGNNNIITIPDRNQRKSEDKIFQILNHQYDKDNALSPIESARFRIVDHIAKLRNNSVTNLFLGIATAVIGVLVLFTVILQAKDFYDISNHIFESRGFIIVAVIPKLSITVFVQVFSYFFLAMYRSNQNDIKYFQNEITVLDSFATAIIAAYGNAANTKLVLSALSKNERNRVLKKGEKPLIATDEADLIHALSILSQINKHQG
jgi:uncharacterized membrane protein